MIEKGFASYRFCSQADKAATIHLMDMARGNEATEWLRNLSEKTAQCVSIYCVYLQF